MHTYVVRLAEDDLARRRLSGVAEEVDSGVVTPFRGVDALAAILLSGAPAPPPAPRPAAERRLIDVSEAIPSKPEPSVKPGSGGASGR